MATILRYFSDLNCFETGSYSVLAGPELSMLTPRVGVNRCESTLLTCLYKMKWLGG